MPNVHIEENKALASQKAAALITSIIERNISPYFTPNLAFPTGETPTELYKSLVKLHHEKGTYLNECVFFMLDEYEGLAQDHPQSFYSFLHQNLFQYVQPKEIYALDGMTTHPKHMCTEYEKKLHDLKGLDICVLGLGHNGHIAFNEPGVSFTSSTHRIKLSEETRQTNARFFESEEHVPSHAFTLGIQTILQSKTIILLAFGLDKSFAVKTMLQGAVTEMFPASALQGHSSLHIFLDQESAQDLRR